MLSHRVVGLLLRERQRKIPQTVWRMKRVRSVVWQSYTYSESRCFSSSQRLLKTSEQEQSQKPTVGGQQSRFADFERALFRRLEQAGFRRSKKFYGSLILAFISVGIGYLYFFPHKLRQQVVEEVSTVASKSLEDEKIVTKAGQLSKDVLSDILNDDGTKLVASDFVKDVIVSDPIKNAAIGTILGLLNDPQVLELLRVRLSQIILNILQDDATRQIVLSQVNTILQHETIRKSLQQLLLDLTNMPEVQVLMAEFFRDVLSSDTVKNQGKIFGQQVTTDVISNKEIQEQAGNAIWAAVKYSVIPNMFRGKGSLAKNVETDKENEDEAGISDEPASRNLKESTYPKDEYDYPGDLSRMDRYTVDNDK